MTTTEAMSHGVQRQIEGLNAASEALADKMDATGVDLWQEIISNHADVLTLKMREMYRIGWTVQEINIWCYERFMEVGETFPLSFIHLKAMERFKAWHEA